MSQDSSRRRRTPLGWRIVRSAVLAYLLIVLLMTFLETWLVYPIPSGTQANWNPSHLDHEEVDFTSADGTRLHGWLFAHPDPEHVVLYCHGNGEHVASNGEYMDFLRDELAATVLVFDYRGYGKSEGRPHEAGVVADGKAAHQWLANHAGVATDDVVLMGRSLGGGVAIAAAEDLGARAIVLQNTFASMVGTAARMYPWLPVRLMMRNRYDSLARIQSYNGPVLQSHGVDDTIVAIDDARILFEAIPSAGKRFLELPGGHNSPMPPDYFDQLREFLQETTPAETVD